MQAHASIATQLRYSLTNSTEIVALIPSKLTLNPAGEETTTIETPYEGNGYQFEAAELMACLRAHRMESDLMPLDETLAIMQTLDATRAQ